MTVKTRLSPREETTLWAPSSPFAFFLTFPVPWFLVILPVLNWTVVRWVGFPKAILTQYGTNIRGKARILYDAAEP